MKKQLAEKLNNKVDSFIDKIPWLKKFLEITVSFFSILLFITHLTFMQKTKLVLF